MKAHNHTSGRPAKALAFAIAGLACLFLPAEALTPCEEGLAGKSSLVNPNVGPCAVAATADDEPDLRESGARLMQASGDCQGDGSCAFSDF